MKEKEIAGKREVQRRDHNEWERDNTNCAKEIPRTAGSRFDGLNRAEQERSFEIRFGVLSLCVWLVAKARMWHVAGYLFHLEDKLSPAGPCRLGSGVSRGETSGGTNP